MAAPAGGIAGASALAQRSLQEQAGIVRMSAGNTNSQLSLLFLAACPRQRQELETARAEGVVRDLEVAQNQTREDSLAQTNPSRSVVLAKDTLVLSGKHSEHQGQTAKVHAPCFVSLVQSASPARSLLWFPLLATNLPQFKRTNCFPQIVSA